VEISPRFHEGARFSVSAWRALVNAEFKPTLSSQPRSGARIQRPHHSSRPPGRVRGDGKVRHPDQGADTGTVVKCFGLRVIKPWNRCANASMRTSATGRLPACPDRLPVTWSCQRLCAARVSRRVHDVGHSTPNCSRNRSSRVMSPAKAGAIST